LVVHFTIGLSSSHRAVSYTHLDVYKRQREHEIYEFPTELRERLHTAIMAKCRTVSR